MRTRRRKLLTERNHEYGTRCTNLTDSRVDSCRGAHSTVLQSRSQNHTLLLFTEVEKHFLAIGAQYGAGPHRTSEISFVVRSIQIRVRQACDIRVQ